MAPEDRTVENVGRSSSSSSNSNMNSPQHHQRQQEPRTSSERQQIDDNNNSNHQSSLAAMSTTTATTGGAVDVDDVSSMGDGETETNYSTTHSRRKRKDDCSESRCTVTSEEESARSRSRRRRHRLQTSSCHRWLERIDRTAATSHAPIRPSRSDDDVFSPTVAAGWMATATTPLSFQQQQQQQRSFSSSLPRIGVATGHSILHTSATASGMSYATSRGGRSYSDADLTAREVARCQSLSLPPVRPTRENSRTDLMDSDDDDDDDDSDRKASGKNAPDDKNNEIDPHMYARLLHGDLSYTSGSMDQLPSLSCRSGSGGIRNDYAARSAPPKKPRRRSDPDTLPAFLFNALEKQRVPQTPALMRFNTVAVTPSHGPSDLTSASAVNNRTSTTTGNSTGSGGHHVCPQDCQTMRGETCQHAISPKPPAQPLRTVDDRRKKGRCCNTTKMPLIQASADLEVPSLRHVHRVSDQTKNLEKDAAASRRETGPGLQDDHHKNDTSASSGMDLEEEEEEEEDVKPRADEGCKAIHHKVEKDNAEEEDEELFEHEEDDEDETETSGRSSLKEYDPDLFARLLSGDADSSARQQTTRTLSAKNNEDKRPPPSLVARVSSGTTATRPHPGYNRFDNSAPCAVPEHMAGAVKSSHPPMRPRRSIDECLKSDDTGKYNDTLAAAVAAAFVAEAVENASGTPDPEMPPPVRLVGNKRRASRRLSRRLTLPLASEMPSSNENDNGQSARNEVEPLDSTREANLVAFSKPLDESYCDASDTADGRDDDYERHYEESEASCTAADGSYSRILPGRRRRRVMRRFTMPSKGRSLSPLTKKRRTVGRSVSLRSSNEEMMTPAA